MERSTLIKTEQACRGSYPVATDANDNGGGCFLSHNGRKANIHTNSYKLRDAGGAITPCILDVSGLNLGRDTGLLVLHHVIFFFP
jgi:hypothetical protein